MNVRALGLATAITVYTLLVAGATTRFGANYEEVVPYVLSPLDVHEFFPIETTGTAPRLVKSQQLPRLAFEPVTGLRLPILNQPYMTNHLSYGGIALAAAGLDPLWAARLWHAAFGCVLLWLLFDVALLLGLGQRAAWIAVASAATSLQVTFMYTWARFDESLPSFGAVAVLWAALRHGRDRRQLWIWIGVLAAAVSVSAKVTGSWPLAGLAAAAFLAGWRLPPVSALVRPLLASAFLFLPIIGFSFADDQTSGQVALRLGFLKDLFDSDVLPGTAANLIDYLGSWGAILSRLIRGVDAAHAPNVSGWVLVSATLGWLCLRAVLPGTLPRRRRVETHMLVVVIVVFAFVAMFYREHRDYQFVLLVPLHALALGAFLDAVSTRVLDRRLPAWLAGAVVLALPIASNLRDQVWFQRDLGQARNAMFDLQVQRQSAAWLAEHGVDHPIVVTFYAVGTYELFTNGQVQPVYPFPLFRYARDGSYVPDLPGLWRRFLANAGEGGIFVVLPLGENPVEARHFDEPKIRAAMLEVAKGERVAAFANRDGEPLLEVWNVTLRSEQGAPAALPPAPS